MSTRLQYIYFFLYMYVYIFFIYLFWKCDITSPKLMVQGPLTTLKTPNSGPGLDVTLTCFCFICWFIKMIAFIFFPEVQMSVPLHES